MEKKADKPELKSLLEDVKVGKDHISGRMGEFQLDFAKNGVINARKEYQDAGSTVNKFEGGRFVEEKVKIPKVEISVTYDMWALLPDKLAEIRKIEAEFSLKGEKHKMQGEINSEGGIMWHETEKEEQVHFSDSFHRKISNEFLPMAEQLFMIVKLDKDVNAAFKMDMKKRQEFEKTAIILMDRVERISVEYDILKNPQNILNLQPVFDAAQNSGAVKQFRMELLGRITGNMLEMNRLGYNSPLSEDMRRRQDRLTALFNAFEKFMKEEKKTKKDGSG